MRMRCNSVIAAGLVFGLVASSASAQTPQRQRRPGALGQAQGQGQRRPGQGMMPPLSLLQMPDPLLSQFQLSEEQNGKLKAIRMKTQEETRALFGQGGNPQEAFPKIREIREKADAEANALLNADQKKKLEALAELARLGAPNGLIIAASYSSARGSRPPGLRGRFLASMCPP